VKKRIVNMLKIIKIIIYLHRQMMAFVVFILKRVLNI